VKITMRCAMMRADGRTMARKGMKLTPEAVELVASRFRILGEPVRIRIVQALEDGEMNVTELVTSVGSTQPNVSKHLRILQEAGIVGRRQQGNNVYYFIADESVIELCEAVCGSLRTQAEQTAKLLGVSRRR
jgi:DNA-binding transcriptional ArsR family regulator